MLFDAGNYQGSIQILETLKAKGRLFEENKEILSESYFRSAQEKLRTKNFDAAIPLLESIGQSSKRYTEARDLLKKLKGRRKSPN